MGCRTCQLKGFVLVREPAGFTWLPCPDCGGYGTLHCCEGDQAQAETTDQETEHAADPWAWWHDLGGGG
jgi:hypothetical protein